MESRHRDDHVCIRTATLRQAIDAMRDLLRLPDNRAAQSKARIYAGILEDHLPESLEKALKELGMTMGEVREESIKWAERTHQKDS